MNLIIAVQIFVNKHNKKITIGLVIGYIIFISLLLIAKYNAFGFTALDLGIYNQVFFNTTEGRLFEMSIHPHSYLGDHFELFILVLIPLYKIFASPITLLILQTIFIGLAAWPLYLIAKQKLSSSWSLMVILIFLFNPLILNLQFFEFHILPFAIFTLLFSFYFYYKNKFTPFLIFILISIIIREDVSLVIIMFGILAWIDKRDLKWILTPIIIGVSWFIMAMQLTGYFNQSGNYKFLSMYGWLGNSMSEMIKNIFTKPWILLKQIFSFNNILSVVGIFLPLAALPLLKPKYLIPSILVGGQLLLLSASSAIILKTHYTSLLLPFIFISLIFSLKYFIQTTSSRNKLFQFFIEQRILFFAIFFTAIIYSFLTISPIIPAISSLFNEDKANIKVANELIKQVSASESVISSFKYLPNLSDRVNVYSLHYAFFGKKQFTDIDFDINVPIDKAIIDFNDYTIYYLQSKYSSNKTGLYPDGAERIKNIIAEHNLKLTSITDTQAIFTKNALTDIKLINENILPTINNINEKINDNLTLLAINKSTNIFSTLPLKFFWQVNNKIEDNYFIQLRLTNKNREIEYSKIYPIGYGLYPTSSWKNNMATNYWFSLPDNYSLDTYQLSFQVVNIIDGRLNLDGQRSAVKSIYKSENIGPEIIVDYNNL
ncbi:MAG: DUF2079 domain-containing protein [Candidatus Kerfeldbacteria bacterium]